MKIKKSSMRIFLCLITVVLVAGMVLACSEPAPEPTTSTPSPTTTAPEPTTSSPEPTTSAPEPTTSTPEPVETVELICNTTTGNMAPPGYMMEQWAARMAEQTDGQLECKLYFSSALFSPEEALRSVLGGVADAQFAYSGREDPGLMVMNYYYTLPFVGFPNAEVATAVQKDLLDNYPGFYEEYQGLIVYAPTHYVNASYIHTTEKQVLSVADLEGLKIQADGLEAEWLENMGATAVYVPFPDRYVALEKGTVDGDMASFGPMKGVGSEELYKYHLVIPTVARGGYVCTIFNPEKWESLPDNIKKVIMDNEDWLSDTWAALEADTDATGIKRMEEELGHTVAVLSDEEVELMKSYALPLHEKWIMENEEVRRPFYEEVQRLIEQYSAEM